MSVVLVLSGFLTIAPSVAVPSVSIDLAPRARSGDVETVDVTLVFNNTPTVAGEALLQMPLVSSNVDSVASVLKEVSVRDAKGSVKLVARDVELPIRPARDAEIGGKAREWFADRAVSGAFTVHYTVPASASLPPGARHRHSPSAMMGTRLQRPGTSS